MSYDDSGTYFVPIPFPLIDKAEGSKILQEVRLPLKTKEECQTVYNRRVTISSQQVSQRLFLHGHANIHC
jgi:hypothetical protein